MLRLNVGGVKPPSGIPKGRFAGVVVLGLNVESRRRGRGRKNKMNLTNVMANERAYPARRL